MAFFNDLIIIIYRLIFFSLSSYCFALIYQSSRSVRDIFFDFDYQMLILIVFYYFQGIIDFSKCFSIKYFKFKNLVLRVSLMLVIIDHNMTLNNSDTRVKYAVRSLLYKTLPYSIIFDYVHFDYKGQLILSYKSYFHYFQVALIIIDKTTMDAMIHLLYYVVYNIMMGIIVYVVDFIYGWFVNRCLIRVNVMNDKGEVESTHEIKMQFHCISDALRNVTEYYNLDAYECYHRTDNDRVPRFLVLNFWSQNFDVKRSSIYHYLDGKLALKSKIEESFVAQPFYEKVVNDLSGLFMSQNKLKSLDLSNFDTSGIENMNDMFSNLDKLESIDLSSFELVNVKSLDRMFSGCENLTNLDLSSFYTPNLISCSGMFCNCKKLGLLELNEFKTDNVEVMSQMFKMCSSLITLDLYRFKTTKVNDMREMFDGCKNLKKLNIMKLTTTNKTLTEDMFKGCEDLKNLKYKAKNNDAIANELEKSRR